MIDKDDPDTGTVERIDLKLLGPVRTSSEKAQIHLTLFENGRTWECTGTALVITQREGLRESHYVNRSAKV